MKRNLVLYGLLAGIFLTAYVNLLDYSKIIYQTTWGMYAGYLAILILPLCIYFALNELRKKQGELLFKQSLMVSMLIALMASTIYSAYTFIDIHFFDAAHLHNLFDFTAQKLKAEGKSITEVQERLESLHKHYFSYKPYTYTFIWYVGMGLLYGILFFFIYKFRYRKQVS